MSDTSERYKNWIVSTTPDPHYLKHFKRYPHHERYISEFESDVTSDPFWHPKKAKIVKIQREVSRYPKGTYRWAKGKQLRIAYYPEKETHTIYPLDAYPAGSARYKKRG